MENGLLKKRVSQHIAAAKSLEANPALISLAQEAAGRIVACYRKGGKVITMGNGGSAAEAQHMAAELLGKYLKERKALSAVALTANSSSVTAIGNDYGYARVFARQLEGLANKDDIAIGFSTSGNSENIVEAFKAAMQRGVFCISFVGEKKCKLEGLSGICLKASGDSTPRIQEMHNLLMHCICEIVEETLFP